MNAKLIFFSFLLVCFDTDFCSAQRKVLVEQFTNSGCPPCAGNTPVVADYVNDHPDQVLMIAYHAPFPYLDSMYFENPYESDQRLDFYNVSGVPSSRVDGNYFAGNLVPVLASTITARAAIAPRYQISFLSNTLSNNQVTATLLFESIDAANEGQSLQAIVAVVEKNVLKSSYAASPGNNNETEYPWVMRKLLPDDAGTTLINTGLNGTDELTVSWTVDNFKDQSEMRLIAFVQNILTREVYQAEIATPQLTTGIFEGTESEVADFMAYPSPASNFLYVRVNSGYQNSVLKLMDLSGRVVYTGVVSSTESKLSIASFPRGFYFVQLENSEVSVSKKVFLTR